jgi:hypothetical protein
MKRTFEIEWDDSEPLWSSMPRKSLDALALGWCLRTATNIDNKLISIRVIAEHQPFKREPAAAAARGDEG